MDIHRTIYQKSFSNFELYDHEICRSNPVTDSSRTTHTHIWGILAQPTREKCLEAFSQDMPADTSRKRSSIDYAIMTEHPFPPSLEDDTARLAPGGTPDAHMPLGLHQAHTSLHTLLSSRHAPRSHARASLLFPEGLGEAAPVIGMCVGILPLARIIASNGAGERAGRCEPTSRA